MRLDGWEGRLWKVIAAAESRPYELGVHDCFRVACQVVEALTGVDHWTGFAGSYHTRAGAKRVIARHGSSFEAAFDWLLGEHVAPAYARRGDIVAVQDVEREKHLGVCLGVESAFLAPHGLVRLPTLSCLCAWRI